MTFILLTYVVENSVKNIKYLLVFCIPLQNESEKLFNSTSTISLCSGKAMKLDCHDDFFFILFPTSI